MYDRKIIINKKLMNKFKITINQKKNELLDKFSTTEIKKKKKRKLLWNI